MIDSRDISVLTQIMQTLCDDERVWKCTIPKLAARQTIFTLRGLIQSKPKFSSFRVFASCDDDYVSIIRISIAGIPAFYTRTEEIFRLTKQFSEWILPVASSNRAKSSIVRKYAVEDYFLEILLKMHPFEYQSYIPPPVRYNHPMLPLSLCSNNISCWLRSTSSVVIICGSPGCGKNTDLVHYILQECNTQLERCRMLYVLQDDAEVFATAHRIAEERFETVGSTVGYKVDTHTRIRDCTNVALCSDKSMLLSFMSERSSQSFCELTHIIVGNVERRTPTTDLLLSLLREKHRFHPTLKLIVLTESKHVHDLASFFNRPYLIQVPEASLFGVEYAFLDTILTSMRTSSEIMKARKRFPTENPFMVMADVQERYAGQNHSGHLSRFLDALLTRCFYARDPYAFTSLLQVLENNKHLVDYQHTEIKLTALMIAAARGFTGVVQTLLQFGANPFVRGKKQLTAMDWCDQVDRNICHRLMVDVCQSYDPINRHQQNQGRLLCQLYFQIHDPYLVNHFLLMKVVKYIIEKRAPSRILVTLPDFINVLQCYHLLRNSAKAKRIVFMLYHQYITEEELQLMKHFPVTSQIVVILMGGPLLEMLPSHDAIDYVIDTGLRVVKMYDRTNQAYLNTLRYNTETTVSALKSLAKRGFFMLYTPDQLESTPANDKPNRYSLGSPVHVLAVLLVRSEVSSSIESFFDGALTSPTYTDVDRSMQVLAQIGAITRPLKMPTGLGRLLAYLRIELHLGKALLYSVLFKCLDPMLSIVATLIVGNPFVEPLDAKGEQDIVKLKLSMEQRSHSDCLVLLRLYQQWSILKSNQTDQVMIAKYQLKPGVMEAISNVRIDLMATLRALRLVKCGRVQNTSELNEYSDSWTRVKACLAAGFYPNLAKVNSVKKSFQNYSDTIAPLELHPLSVVTLDMLSTKWVIYDHIEDFALAIRDHNSDNSPVHMVENTTLSDSMVMLMCGLDETIARNNNPCPKGDALAVKKDFRPSIPQPGGVWRELLIGEKYMFQLTVDSYNAIMWLRQQIGGIFHEFTNNPHDTLEHRDVTRIIGHLLTILDEEEKNVSLLRPSNIGIRPKIRNHSSMGVLWNQSSQ